MFKYIRLQIIYPCRAQCAWCSTHRKNPLFFQLYRDGIADEIHRFYIETIRKFQPEEVFISGGEPLVYPEIASFLNAIKDSTQRINIFTSYQFSRKECMRIPFVEMPLEKVTLNHTTVYFEPENWRRQTNGFPFDLYAANIKSVMQVSVRKRFKFIVNHPDFPDELQRFRHLMSPDEHCELGLKVINDQGSHLNVSLMQQTKNLVRERTYALDQLVAGTRWGSISRKPGSLEAMLPVLESGDVEQCTYRQEPIELRFALYKADTGRQVLKYRYCPYFPSDFGYRFHIGRDDPAKLQRNYNKGDFHQYCSDCRFLNYCLAN
jgi:organic radical activating enzyme